jgi:hypothetical protein
MERYVTPKNRRRSGRADESAPPDTRSSDPQHRTEEPQAHAVPAVDGSPAAARNGTSGEPDRERRAVQDAAVVIGMLLRGYTDRRVAARLGVTERTIRRRVASLMDAFGARSRFQLGACVAAYQQRGGDTVSSGGSGQVMLEEWHVRVTAPSTLRRADAARLRDFVQHRLDRLHAELQAAGISAAVSK